jgi:formate dehydrogenase maturation protein FdhE
MTAAMFVDERWATRRQRGRDLRARFPYASEVLGLFDALLEVQGPAFEHAVADARVASDVARHVADEVLPRIVDATRAAGPRQLAEAVTSRVRDGGLELLVTRWLCSEEDQPAVDMYLARAASSPVLEALGPASGGARVGTRHERRCPACDGLPQLSVVEAPTEALVGSRRLLLCSRCHGTWPYPRMVCPGCGEKNSARLPIYQEGEWLPHLRVEGCESCGRFVIAVDLRRDGRAVPLVDELVAMPLALHAEEQGLLKIIPNLMGL